ncbi:EamA family transporter [Methylomonas sp. LW13]|uniref:EamA family transporter n=1 Tax=unclassified Methylomonas TaxID=2608980 RepID=UPI00051C4E94|nr:EamA family transporter [Methylomonas sp. LW13]QBC27323.1 EamA family transporter [Methylomonas sp. LW13]
MKAKVWAALLAVYLVWGSTYLMIRFVVETLPPFLSAGLRFVVSGFILLAWRRLAGDAAPTFRQWRSAAVVGILLLLGGNGLVCWAEQTVPSGVAALIIGAVPMFLVMADALRPNGTRPTLRVLVGLVIGFMGIYLLVGPTALSDGIPVNLPGVAALLLASLLWALGSIYSKTADLPKTALMTTGAEMLTGGFALLLVSALSEQWDVFNLAQVSVNSWLALAYLIVFGSMIGFASYAWLLQNAPIPLVATYAYVNPLVAVFLGSWFANEPLTPRVLSAAAIIIGAIVFMNSARGSRAKPAAARGASK